MKDEYKIQDTQLTFYSNRQERLERVTYPEINLLSICLYAKDIKDYNLDQEIFYAPPFTESMPRDKHEYQVIFYAFIYNKCMRTIEELEDAKNSNDEIKRVLGSRFDEIIEFTINLLTKEANVAKNNLDKLIYTEN